MVAWFGIGSITAGLVAKADTTSVTVTKQEKPVVANFDIFDFDADLSYGTGKDGLEYAAYKASTGTYNLVTGYVDDGGNFYELSDPIGSTHVLAAQLTISVKYNTDSANFVKEGDVITHAKDTNNHVYAIDDVLASVKDLTVDVAVSVTSGDARVFALNSSGHAYKESAKTNAGTGKADGTDTGAFYTSISLANLEAIDGATDATVVCWVYVNGGTLATTGQSAETGTPTAQTINVSVSQTPSAGA